MELVDYLKKIRIRGISKKCGYYLILRFLIPLHVLRLCVIWDLFFECFTTFITCDYITVFWCFLLGFTYLKSLRMFVPCQFDGLNFHLVFVCCRFCPSCGFVYLFLYPSRFIRNAACRQLFLYLSVFDLLVTNWEPRVLCCYFWLFFALVIGWFGSLSILSVIATHCWYVLLTEGSLCCDSDYVKESNLLFCHFLFGCFACW